ncbi:MoaD/ThiS family protein [Campylobacter geochelonis]|uniref:Molybdopterin synthase sulfur carrier subunit n=1 Tax=Campylobacter geochelonis TaxID=1780362 RepID=A0A128EME7_9BACT|nr:MoaD/ThiS family protein [Campylobacter geochelonis]QKF72030.1 molybdopterin synthase, sulfur carrier subunit [Campylobacter geochelonis]CZE45756.1 molybdopterin synthase sulfur carrier subunit [Campylobacter geochelonis]CZE46874.1 molybdopterin synthase sulfur carrier subunit [Campylobacter geochelonis]CZE49883.1 molybdopterin synthase sulfur carrier subunit [Campylobacter geochelonis]
MVEIEFLGPINKDSLKLEASNLANLKEILSKDESLKEWLEICAVAVNDTIVCSLDTPLKSGDRISLLPPVCGG